VLHCIVPTKSALPILKLEALVARLVEDRAMIEVTVLADYKNYPRASDLGTGYRDQYTPALEADDVSSSAMLELFRSTVGIGLSCAVPWEPKLARRTGDTRKLSQRRRLEAKAWRKSVGEELPYMTVDDVSGGSANGRAFKLSLEAAVEAIYIEVVPAEKRYASGLDLIKYLEKLCAEVELYQVFR
jgi:hypothetical protein